MGNGGNTGWNYNSDAYDKTGLFLAIGTGGTAGGGGGVLTPTEASMIDVKQDDGIPKTGSILGVNGYISGAWQYDCAVSGGNPSTTNPANNIQYKLTSNEPHCRLLFQIKK